MNDTSAANGELAPLVSVVIPAYNAARYIGECLASITGQTYRNLEVIVVNDCSSDSTAQLVEDIAQRDSRVRLISMPSNAGTLAARKAGVRASRGEWVTLVDQDDELVPQAISSLVTYSAESPADIYHMAARVEPHGAAAESAAAGMTSFLTPSPRRLEGDDILCVQLAEEHGFDWHVHHKFYRGDVARTAYAALADERLTIADDIYASFALCSFAQSYEAIPDSPWYVYHLGRGETLGEQLDLLAYARLARADGRALELARAFARAHADMRDDFAERLCDLRDRLSFHALNEWHDNLADDCKLEGLEMALESLPPVSVAAELWRFTRDRAYALLDAQRAGAAETELHRLAEETKRYWKFAEHAHVADDASNEAGNCARLSSMRETALCHLRDTGLLQTQVAEESSGTLLQKMIRFFHRR